MDDDNSLTNVSLTNVRLITIRIVPNTPLSESLHTFYADCAVCSIISAKYAKQHSLTIFNGVIQGATLEDVVSLKLQLDNKKYTVHYEPYTEEDDK